MKVIKYNKDGDNENIMKNELLSPRLDLVFKRIFGDPRNVDILEDFLRSIINIPEEEYERLELVDPFTKIESEDDKVGILDIKIRSKNKIVINLEIQQGKIPDLKQKLIFYNSQMITNQIQTGNHYDMIKKAISICIINFDHIHDSDDYLNTYWHSNLKNGSTFTQMSEIHVLELTKLKGTDTTKLFNWLFFLKSQTEEEFEMVAETNPMIKKAYAVLKELSADEATRLQAEAREKLLRDIESRINGAKQEGREEGLQEGEAKGREEGLQEGEAKGREKGFYEGEAKGIIQGKLEGIEEGIQKEKREMAINLLRDGFSYENTSKYTGLSIDEINELKDFD